MNSVVFMVPIVAIACGTAVIISAMNLISKHFSDRRPPVSDEAMSEILRRLDRIEQIVDTTGVEVERLAESNRFMSKLLSERSGQQLPR